MSEVETLFKLMVAAPPRAAAIVRRVAIDGVTLEALAKEFAVTPEQARVLLYRATREVQGLGPATAVEEAEAVVLGRPIVLLEQLRTWKDELATRLDQAAEDFARSPDRGRDEWLRKLALAVVIALTAYFWQREQNKPRPPPEPRPTVRPTSP